jgi:hypothetical protein
MFTCSLLVKESLEGIFLTNRKSVGPCKTLETMVDFERGAWFGIKTSERSSGTSVMAEGAIFPFIRYVDMDSSDFSQMYRKSRSNGESENNLDPHTPRGGSFMYLFSDRSSSTRAITGCRERLPVPREIAISALLISPKKCVHFSVELCTLTGAPGTCTASRKNHMDAGFFGVTDGCTKCN